MCVSPNRKDSVLEEVKECDEKGLHKMWAHVVIEVGEVLECLMCGVGVEFGRE